MRIFASFKAILTTLAVVTAITLGFAAAPAQAQSAFPSRPIRILTQFPAGAVSDISLRILADRAGARLGTQIIVQNQPSAAGVTAAREALSAAADGYTLVDALERDRGERCDLQTDAVRSADGFCADLRDERLRLSLSDQLRLRTCTRCRIFSPRRKKSPES